MSQPSQLNPADFQQKYGPWAIVTGGAQGMGAAFARAIGHNGLNLILLDREAELLASTGQTLREELGCEVVTVVSDLANPSFMQDLTAQTEGLDIGLLVACAAVGHVGPFAETPIDDMLSAVRINVDAPLILARHYCEPMLAKGHGGIILFSSNSAYQGTPYVANYAATKAYNLILGEALWYEMGALGVDVLSIVPGGTNTPGFRSANPKLKEGQKVKGILLPEETAAAALAALGKHPSARPSFRDTVETFFMSRILKRKTAIKIIGDKLNSKLKRNI